MKRLVTIVLFIVCLIIPKIAFADSEVFPRTYKELVANDKFVFVMIYEGSPEVKTNDGKVYEKTGLYKNDNSIDSIWTMEGYSHKVFISSDGNYAAMLGPWPRLSGLGGRDLNQLEIAFYDKGKLVKQYYIKDLVVDESKLQKSVSHFQFNKEINFNEAESTIELFTYDESRYVFDMRNGEIVAGQRGINKFMIIVYCFVLSIVLLAVGYRIKKKYK